MNSFVETLSPAARNHAEARIDYYTDLTQAVLHSLRQLTEANVQFSREWLDDSTSALRTALLTPPSERTADAAPKAAEATLHKLQAYHQKLAQVASEFQNELTKVAQERVPQTARTAGELADAGRQAASQHLTEESNRFANLASQNNAMPQAASMQSAPEGNQG
ncbi:phasin family protein [Duganella callida]|uniref:Phasin domain-containing protein n=1 Tax=Duganella callida TaxID=2561932 RepID=A0A4Y9SCA6_9BURK|nr:phasin family protein [Duganella callida]TFW17998.1 hypothetical protein E4L98_19365 [Duganella callida]